MKKIIILSLGLLLIIISNVKANREDTNLIEQKIKIERKIEKDINESVKKIIGPDKTQVTVNVNPDTEIFKKDRVFEVKNIKVNLLISKEVNDQKLMTLENIINDMLDLNTERGDKLTLKRADFYQPKLSFIKNPFMWSSIVLVIIYIFTLGFKRSNH